MRHLLHAYDRCLTSSPILTKVITSGFLFGIGDVSAQYLTSKYKNNNNQSFVYDWHRTSRMIFWGGVVFAPTGHLWMNFLDKVVRTTGKRAIFDKVAMDMLIFTPPLNLAFFSCNNLLSGQPMKEAFDNACMKLPPTLKVNYLVWPWIQVVTFGYIPLQYRVLFINVMCLGWSSFLSIMAAEEVSTKSVLL